jgi:hypothetical protein
LEAVASFDAGSAKCLTSTEKPFPLDGLFILLLVLIILCFQNLPIFSLVEPFWVKNKFFNFFGHRAEKMCIFAPLIEKP